MKTFKIKLAFILVILYFNNNFAQTNMSKKQILRRWEEADSLFHEKESVLANFIFSDSLLTKSVCYEIKKLNDKAIDSFGLFQIAYPGFYGKNDSCNTGIYPTQNYLFWIFESKTYYKMLSGRCKYESMMPLRSVFFYYYLKNSREIDSEKILPVILSAQILADNSVSFAVKEIDHEAKYKLYIQVGKDFRLFRFSESSITNKKNLFYRDNNNSKLYKLVVLLEKELNITGS